MQKRIEYCTPKAVKAAPAGPDWIHEIKMDGYRGLLERDGDSVRLRSRTGLDWTWRYPLIVEAALKLRTKRFVLDGEIVILTERGDADFDALHGNKRNSEAQLYAFDCLVLAGDDLRERPLFERKDRLGRLLTDPNAAIFPAPFQPGELGPGLFRAACTAGLEGIVSKHRDTRYRPRTCDWRKIKNREHPAFSREL